MDEPRLAQEIRHVIQEFDLWSILILIGPIVRIASNHLSFNDHAAQKVIYGFGTKDVPSMKKDPRFFTPEVDHTSTYFS